MEHLILILKKQGTETYHPAIFFEKTSAYQEEEEKTERSYKYKFVNQDGFVDRPLAVEEINTVILESLSRQNHKVLLDIQADTAWDGKLKTLRSMLITKPIEETNESTVPDVPPIEIPLPPSNVIPTPPPVVPAIEENQ